MPNVRHWALYEKWFVKLCLFLFVVTSFHNQQWGKQHSHVPSNVYILLTWYWIKAGIMHKIMQKLKEGRSKSFCWPGSTDCWEASSMTGGISPGSAWSPGRCSARWSSRPLTWLSHSGWTSPPRQAWSSRSLWGAWNTNLEVSIQLNLWRTNNVEDEEDV